MGAIAARTIPTLAVAVSLAVTAAMSLAFHGTVRADFLATGLVSAVVTYGAVARVTAPLRRALREANRALERRVADRTAALAGALEDLAREHRDRIALEQALRVTDRLATAGTLAAGVAHEIRNPLSAIVLNLGAAEDDLEVDSTAAREALQAALEAAHQLETVARDLGTLARPHDEEAGPVDLARVAASVVRLAGPQVRKVGEVDLALAGLPPVLGTAPRLVQVLLNLVLNAAHASRPDVPNRIRIAGERIADGVRLTVSDSGTGMPPAVLARAFEPHFTTRAGSGGTGLGLAIVQGIVEGLGGRVWAESDEGVGTKVHVLLQPHSDGLSEASPGPEPVRVEA